MSIPHTIQERGSVCQRWMYWCKICETIQQQKKKTFFKILSEVNCHSERNKSCTKKAL